MNILQDHGCICLHKLDCTIVTLVCKLCIYKTGMEQGIVATQALGLISSLAYEPLRSSLHCSSVVESGPCQPLILSSVSLWSTELNVAKTVLLVCQHFNVSLHSFIHFQPNYSSKRLLLRRELLQRELWRVHSRMHVSEEQVANLGEVFFFKPCHCMIPTDHFHDHTRRTIHTHTITEHCTTMIIEFSPLFRVFLAPNIPCYSVL